jgi:hypothetical protein
MFAGEDSWSHTLYLASGIELGLDGRRRWYFHRIDGELGTNDFTIVAIDTFVRFDHNRWMIALAIVCFRKLEDILGTEYDAVAAAFAAVVNDMDQALGDLYFLCVKRNSPECHVACL